MSKPITKPWNEYPIGTKANAVNGGYWIKIKHGWKWCTGDMFPHPGGDAISVTLPKYKTRLTITQEGREKK